MQANQQIPYANRSYTLSGEPALFADRGFTGHEFLSDFNLYNMNGRLYDPVLGRFLSPDPYIADPSFTQSYNRYSYVLNNPLKYNDPTGELPGWALWGIATAGNWLFGGMDNWINKGMSFKQSFSTAYNPIVFSGNYHPGNNSWSNTQVNAHRLVGSMANAERGAHNHIAGFSGMGRYGEGPMFATTPLPQFVGESPLAYGVASSEGGVPWYVSASYGVLGFIATDVSIPEPTDLAVPKWVGYAVSSALAGTVVAVHANSKNSPNQNIVYEIYSFNANGFQTMKYGVSSRSDFVTRSGNPRPEYQCVALKLITPPGNYYWYSILARTPDRASALSMERNLVQNYIKVHGVRPPLQFRP